MALVADGGVALVRGEDGALRLPEFSGWDGEPWLYLKAMADLGDAAPAPLRSAATHLTPLHYGQGGTAVVALAEARASGVGADGWWRPGDPAPEGLPTQALVSMETALTGRFAGAPWPAFCLPGATELLRATIAADPALAGRATISVEAAMPGEGELIQEQGWPLSSVWRNAELVLKLTNPGWPGEARVTQLLARAAPGQVPEVLSAGTVPGAPNDVPYLVQRRVVEPPEAPPGPERLARSVAALRALGEVQLAFTGREDELLGAGAPDRSPARTAAELSWLFESVRDGLEPDDRAKLGTLGVLAREVLARLERSPRVVVHGDLHLGNVLASDSGESQLIDWTDAALAWPGVDAYLLVRRLEGTEEEQEELVSAYVAALGPDHEQGVRLGLEVAPLYHALSYLRIREFLPSELIGPFGGEVVRLVKRQMDVFGL